MTKQRVQPGHVILIPIASARYAVGQVLFVSKVFRNVILLALYDQCVTAAVMPDALGKVAHNLYTSRVPIQIGRWIAVGLNASHCNNPLVTQRIVGGEVWIEDTCLRPATKEDLQILPTMGVMGATLVERKALALVR